MDITALEVLTIDGCKTEFYYGILTPNDTLPRGIVIPCHDPHYTAENTELSGEEYLKNGLIFAFVLPKTSRYTINDVLDASSALIDILRTKYKYLPIISTGNGLSSVTARALADEERDRISGVIVGYPDIPTPGIISILKYSLLSLLKGKEYVGKNGLSPFTEKSYFKKLKELDSATGLADYPAHMPTLILNAKTDVLFEALDDNYVSGVEKALCDTMEQEFCTGIDFINRVIEGVNDALSTDSFIYRGENK